ncbi:hypothetical protein IQ259_09010 [Fortiea sp. LEGE XX443]|uniref:hypothetical protein n=1 Tax=Fortiea sp. LEGE XX443 TaxID=1828611 RepID=UPI001882D4D3|nr:hypothetical protein [Fortiea sp. LEGE XX443]MBE9005178.1 hypothetical protein [Fortiea sp. LEGE XX443]
MLIQTIASDLLVDLSLDKQELLTGGCKHKRRGEEPTQGTSPAESSPIASSPSARLAVGNIITVTPFAKCLPGDTCSGGEMSPMED